ncbi:MAG: phosphopantetheine-binding protein, partial [Thermodesulfovibrionales bacterium]
ALGGDSLRATQVVVRLVKEFGPDVPILTVFQYPSLAEFAANIAQRQLLATDDNELIDLLAEIENLSEEDVANRLNH